jgi:hypothetical protein
MSREIAKRKEQDSNLRRFAPGRAGTRPSLGRFEYPSSSDKPQNVCRLRRLYLMASQGFRIGGPQTIGHHSDARLTSRAW